MIFFSTGSIKSHFTPTVFNIGITGLEIIRDENGNLLDSYNRWSGVIERCYSEKYKNNHPTYKNVTCYDKWIYYKNFKEWYNENYYEIDNERMALDKDILHKNNKIYSPNNCVFVPERINGLFIKRQNDRGEYPIGVYYSKQNKGFVAQCNIIDKATSKTHRKRLGTFDNPIKAFYEGYKPFKEKYIKQVADEYKQQIPKKLYDALYKYEVEITD